MYDSCLALTSKLNKTRQEMFYSLLILDSSVIFFLILITVPAACKEKQNAVTVNAVMNSDRCGYSSTTQLSWMQQLMTE